MLAFSFDYDDEPCPISDDALADLYAAKHGSLAGLLDDLEPEIRPALALFCYRRAHLQTIGLAVAACCGEAELASFGGSAGTALYARSREGQIFALAAPASQSRRKVSLARGPLWNTRLPE